MDRSRDLIILDSTFLTTTADIEEYVTLALTKAKVAHISSDHGMILRLYGRGKFGKVHFLTHTSPRESRIEPILNSFEHKSHIVWGYKHPSLVTNKLMSVNRAKFEGAGWKSITENFGFPETHEFFNPFVFIWTNDTDSVEWARKIRAVAMTTRTKVTIEE